MNILYKIADALFLVNSSLILKISHVVLFEICNRFKDEFIKVRKSEINTIFSTRICNKISSSLVDRLRII